MKIATLARVLAKQKELGFEIFTDGELRRRNFMSDFTDAVEGFDLGDAVTRMWDASEAKDAAVSRVTGVVTKQTAAGAAVDGTRTALLKDAQSRLDQNDAAERDAVSGHFV